MTQAGAVIETKIPGFFIRWASAEDAPLILSFIRALAEYEELLPEVSATPEGLRETLFGEKRFAEAIIGEYRGEPAGFAIFFHNYSTFLGKPGLYLEDLFVKPELRGRGLARAMLSFLAGTALERGCGRCEWWVLDWNEPALQFYRKLGAAPMSEWTVQRLTGEALRRLAEEGGGLSPSIKTAPSARIDI